MSSEDTPTSQQIVERCINKIFADVSILQNLDSGDMSVEQNNAIDRIESELIEIVDDFVKQNS